MLLRVENYKEGKSVTFEVDSFPKANDVLSLDGKLFTINNLIEFTSHTTVLVKETKLYRVFLSQIVGVDNEQTNS